MKKETGKKRGGGGGLRFLIVCTQEIGGVIQMRTVCNRGRGGGSKNRGEMCM